MQNSRFNRERKKEKKWMNGDKSRLKTFFQIKFIRIMKAGIQ